VITAAILLVPALAMSQPVRQAAPSDAIAANVAPGVAPSVMDAPAPEQPVTADEVLIDGRRRPGHQKELPDKVEQDNPGAVNAPEPEAFYDKYDGDGPMDAMMVDTGVPDRWRIVSSLCPKRSPTDQGPPAIYTLFPKLAYMCHSQADPFHHNTLKGDRPLAPGKRPGFLKGDDWFFIVNGVSDTVVEPRSFPIPVGNQTTTNPGEIDVFGRSHSLVLSQTFIAGVSLLKGLTAFKPPIVEYRISIAGNINHVEVPERRVLYVEPSKGTKRTDGFIGLQEAFIDYHIGRFDTKRYDFVSLRVGIQPFQSDFRGFLFNDNQLGVRLFGNRDNNRVQFNLAGFWRIEKDTNSGLNDIGQPLRRDWILTGNLYRQDFPVVGLTSQISVTWNRNRETRIYSDKNGFPVRPALLGTLRPHTYDVVYLGYGADGHVGRLNLTAQVYGALGKDHESFLTNASANIRSWFAAAEASYDKDWMRFRVSGLYASGDSNPYDNTEGGFDAILENPQFAGADTSYWIRQTIPFAGGGRAVSVNGRNGVLNSLRSSKDQGQSNFNNPGTVLAGLGGDFDLTPNLRVTANANHLWFANTKVIQVLRNEGSISKDIGWDLSLSSTWRPRAAQNVVFRLSGAVLQAGGGFRDLFDKRGHGRQFYSVLANATLSF